MQKHLKLGPSLLVKLLIDDLRYLLPVLFQFRLPAVDKVGLPVVLKRDFSAVSDSEQELIVKGIAYLLYPVVFPLRPLPVYLLILFIRHLSPCEVFLTGYLILGGLLALLYEP